MSWNATGKAIVDYDGVALHLDVKNPQQGYGERESEVAMDLAANAARTILTGRGGTLAALDFRGGMGLGVFNVTLSGHANPNHKPTEGWSNDYISVSISKEK